jgi:hypothetical protein
MSKNSQAGRRSLAVVAAATVLALAAGGGAVAGSLITSKDIQDKTITSADLHKNSVKTQKVKDGTLKIQDLNKKAQDALKKTGPAGPAGPVGPTGPQGPKGDSGTATYAGPNWGIIDRNTEGGGDGFLRAGPTSAAFGVALSKPPRGIGSLGLRTGSSTDKIAFGNEVDYAGTALTSMNTVSYSVYTTGENIGRYNENLPGVTFEIVPGTATGGSINRTYSSLVYVPVQAAAGWSQQNASTAARWFLTGNAATDINCTQATYCTLAQVKAGFPNATVQTVALTKGKDYAFSGAVDALRLNGDVYDFEPLGVTKTTP